MQLKHAMMHACLPCTSWLTCLSKPWAKNPQIEFKHADKCGYFKEIKLPIALIPIFILEIFFLRTLSRCWALAETHNDKRKCRTPT